MDYKKWAIEDLKQYNTLAKSSNAAERKQAKVIERVLMLLTPQERVILDQFYINKSKYHIERLKQVLRIEQAQIYRLKNRALEKYTTMSFGVSFSDT